MSTWPDDQLEGLLRETFTSAERLADPERAARIAEQARPSPRRWPAVLASAAAVAIVAGGTAYVVTRGGDEPAPSVAGPTTAAFSPSTSSPPASSPPTTAPSGGTTRDNISATRAQSAWMLHAVPMPDGSREWRTSPEPAFREQTMSMGPSDARFTRTTWWTVPMSIAEFTSWLRSHVPEGFAGPPTDGGAYSVGEGRMAQVEELDTAGSNAYTGGSLAFSLLPYEGGLVARVDTFISPRFARTVFVPEDTSEVRIGRTVSHPYAAKPHTRRATVMLTEPADVSELVGEVNALPGSSTASSGSCPLTTTKVDYRVSFPTSAGTFALRFEGGPCWPQVTLLHDGNKVGPTLDPGDLAATLDGYLERR